MLWWMWLIGLLGILFGIVLGVVVGGSALGLWVRSRAAREAKLEPHHREVFALDRSIGVGRRLRGLIVEIVCQSIVFTMQGLYRLRLLPMYRGDGGGTPVLVLPGYTEDSGAMWWTARGLAKRGCNPVLVDFPSTFAPIERNAQFLGKRIAELRAEHGGRPVLVLAHSMGGLVARTWMHEAEEHGIAALVAIASPFGGTTTASLAATFRMGASVVQMRPSSELLLRYPPELGCPVPAMCIVALQETIVMPEWSVTLAGARLEVLQEPYGHTAPLLVSESLDLAAEFLHAHDPLRCVQSSTRPVVAASEPAREVV